MAAYVVSLKMVGWRSGAWSAAVKLASILKLLGGLGARFATNVHVQSFPQFTCKEVCMRSQLRHLAFLAALASAPAFGFAQSPAASASAQGGAATTTQNSATARTTSSPENPAGPQSAAGTRSGQTRSAQTQAGTTQTGTVQGGTVQSDAGLRGTVQGGTVQPLQRQLGQTGQTPGGMTVSGFLAHKLRHGNQAEVELGKVASEKAKNDSVKQFAQTMVKHHTEMIQRIDQANIGAGQGARGQGERGEGAGGAGGAQGRQGVRQLVGQSEPSAQAGSNVRNSQSNTNGEERAVTPPGGTSQGSSAAGQAGGATPVTGTASPAAATTANPGINPAAGQAGSVTNAQTTTQAGRPAGAQGGQGGEGAGRGRGMGARVPQQLIAVVDQAGDNELQMTKDMLQKKEGEDFDMCYIGQQIVAHTCMLAKLEAIKNSGPDDLEPIVTHAAETTRQHLDMATKIAEELKGKK